MALFEKTQYAVCSLTQRNIKTGQTKTIEWNLPIKESELGKAADELDKILRSHSVILKGKDTKAEYGTSFTTEDIYKVLASKAKNKGLRDTLKGILSDEDMDLEKAGNKLKQSLEGHKDDFETGIKAARDKYGLFQTSTFIDVEGKFIETYIMTVLED